MKQLSILFRYLPELIGTRKSFDKCFCSQILIPSRDTFEADSAVATVNDLHSATLYDSDGLASPIGIGQETACAAEMHFWCWELNVLKGWILRI